MARLVASVVLGLTLALPALPARAALDVGERAPDFTTSAARAGTVFQYSLADALRKGPVILYFFPAAFSEGCSVEAHAFADAMPQFEALGATVVGVSGDESTRCRNSRCRRARTGSRWRPIPRSRS